jgi:hypothetical protein
MTDPRADGVAGAPPRASEGVCPINVEGGISMGESQ